MMSNMIGYHVDNMQIHNIVRCQKQHLTCQPLILVVSVGLCFGALDVNEYVTDRTSWAVLAPPLGGGGRGL